MFAVYWFNETKNGIARPANYKMIVPSIPNTPQIPPKAEKNDKFQITNAKKSFKL